MHLHDFRVLTFDCYGTLIDWESGIFAALGRCLPSSLFRSGAMPRWSAFARHESAQEAETPRMRYSDLLAKVHRRLAEEWGIAADEEAEQRFRRFGAGLAGLSQFGAGACRAQAALPIGHSLQCGSQELRRQQPEARCDLRCRLHGRGCRLVQARSRQFPLYARAPGGAWDAQERNPAHGAKSFPRSCSGEARGPRDRLDRSPPWHGGLRRDHAAARGCALRFPLPEPCRDGRGVREEERDRLPQGAG